MRIFLIDLQRRMIERIEGRSHSKMGQHHGFRNARGSRGKTKGKNIIFFSFYNG